ncbi:histone-lysine N-methyltransferase, H3 lysine-9 specific SUVH1 [Ricinus communis]|uniref:Histone-lysine n-methyltransferase, suvh, putative n=1 Tax=Ricinus communis TaxID=3988 RepID=B9SHW2_RICCO|nr:histone-lysine N-methyltransferase, H3 lysine-9 specific SUVH1 [Ricinus communis]XP_015578737.1 histone-lysine N-methyltransferase, H3 lysine-9 specific SUVH1 [Ricinus communis]EEF36840.1 histone-lysine n-methyltransferase, suvh, putative [Ricinus communis]|eukprot:XP_002525581.1 histone-lysine N-methyltransferase, H3 lysine-9 specific SUVH1 [Ricinus communis]
MEGGSGNNSVPPSSTFDKSRVLDVKPLRTLVPVFPNSPQTPPFICAPPNGPFPSGFSPFYPFNGPQLAATTTASTPPDLNQETHTPAPLRSFRAPQSNGGVSRGGNEEGTSDGRPKRPVGRPRNSTSSSQKRAKKDLDFTLSVVDNNFVAGITPSQREDGDRGVVINIMMRFDALRRRLSQLEDSKEAPTGLIKRADLKAGNVLMSKGVRSNMRKRIGAVPGVEIGDIFFFRMEMCVIGLHSQSMAGIDYMIVRGDIDEDPLAVSIVSSGGYDDEAEDRDVLIYSGQGGNANSNKKEAADQKLERGNLALERSLHRANEVRVIRGMKDTLSQAAKVYMYDGLYRIQESWVDKGKSGCNIFKYKLVRVPGQPGAFSVWKSIQQWKEGISTRVGLILPDLTSGAETLPVSLVNDVDEEKGPAYFTYFPTVKYIKSFKLTEPSYGCNCRNACSPGDLDCSCIRKNGGDFPYTANGVLVSRRPLVHECGPTCPCIPNCKNRVSQTGLKVRLEVFKTKDRGWGLRSWDPIRSGTFICEYAGEVIEKVKGKQDGEGEDEYVFDTTRVYEPFKWNCEPGLVEEGDNDITEECNIPSPLIISARNVGNVARFMNHSCNPNVFWQPVAYEHNSESYVHIAFFAVRHIPPMTELTYDYGISRSDEAEGNNNVQHGRKKCLCGSQKCRGSFG